MTKRENDILDDLFRDKLYGFEADIHPDDWEIIESRLPAAPAPVVRSLRRRWMYSAAAVVAGLVMITGTLYVTKTDNTLHPLAGQTTEPAVTIEQPVAELPVQEVEVPTATMPETPVMAMAAATVTHPTAAQATTGIATTAERVGIIEATGPVIDMTPDDIPQPDDMTTVTDTDNSAKDKIPVSVPVIQDSRTTMIADATPPEITKESKPRRWGFGMGGGSLTAGANNTLNMLAYQNVSAKVNDNLLFLNAPSENNDLKTNVKHKTPVSFGMSVSYHLNNRFSIVSGLNYTMITSDWDTEGDYHTHTRQRLHFLGIPVSLSYRIAEWNRLQVYAATGFMPELNVSGIIKTNEYVDDIMTGSTTENTRIKPLYWSVNARGGISYPVVKYVNAFAEVGAAYYFDNGTEIETVRSEKPFNVSFNFGLRLGF